MIGRYLSVLLVALFGIAGGLGAQGCSSLNRSGPETSCGDLGNGAINACKEGIIASCADGKTVSYEVCTGGDGDETCEAEWQVPGAFACEKRSDSAPASCLPPATSSCGSCLSGVCPQDVAACAQNAVCATTCRGPLASGLTACVNQCSSGAEGPCRGYRPGSQ